MLGFGTGAPIVQVYHEKSIILPDVSRVLACLYEKDIKFETHTASYKSLLRLQASSHAPVPFYDGPTFLEESREICRYIAEKYEHHGYPFLFGKDALERASVEQWLHNEEHAFNPPSRALFCHLAFPLDEEDDGDDIDMHAKKLEEVLEVYEQRLSDSEFLAGNKFTLADLVHLPNSHYIKASNKFLYLYDSRKNVRRWWDAISSRDSWKKVLMDMKRVEEQEELRKQQQQQKQHPRISGPPIRIDSQKKTSAEPRTILIPRADTVLSSPRFPQTDEPLPIDTFPNEAHVSSSQNTPIANETSAVFTAPPETPSASVRSTPVTSKKYPIPVQSTEGTASPTTAKKPPITDVAKSITEDALILEPPETDLPTRHAPTSSEDVSNNLDVSDYYPSNTDEETPYIEPTPRKTTEILKTFDGSKIATGHAKTHPISAKKDSDQPGPPDFYRSDRRATGVDSQFKESVPYSGRTSPKLEPTDASASKLHTTDVHRRLQAEQWHTATGLNDLKQDAGHLMSTQQENSSKSLKRYPPQDSEQTTSHPVPEEPMGMELVQRRENTTRRPYTDQRSRGIVEDKSSSDQRALLPPSTEEHGAPSSSQEAAKDSRSRIPSQAGYSDGQDTNKQPRGPASVPRQRAAQDARGTFGESKAADSTISSERFSDASRSSFPRQDLDGARYTTAPFEKRDPGTEGTSKQVKDKNSTPWQMTDQATEDTTEETKISDSSSSQVQPSYFQRAVAPSWKQKTGEDHHSATSAIQAKHANDEDTAGISRDVAFKPKEMIGQYDQDTFKETESDGPSLRRDQQSDTWQAASTLPEQEVDQDGRSVAPPSQTRYPSSTPPTKTRYQIAKDARKQPRGTAPTPEKKAAQDDNETSEESKIADEAAPTEQPLNAWRAPISPQRQDAKDSSRTNTSFQKRYPDDEDMQDANTASVSRQISPDGGKGVFEDTKLADSTTRSAKPLYTERSALPFPRQAEVEDAQDKGRQSRVTIPESQKIVARDAQDTHGERRKTATPREQPSHRLQAIPQSRLAAAKDVPSATGETKISRVTFEETKDPDSKPREQFLGARDAQRTNGEFRTPTSDQRKEVSRQLQPDTQDPFQQSKLPAIDQKGLGSSSLKERDAKDDQGTSEEKSISTERHREMIKSESRGSIKVERTSSTKPPVAQDNQGQAQIMEADKKTNVSTPKHQQDSDVTSDEKLNTTAPANAKTRYDYGAEEPSYRKDTDDQKSVPPLLRKGPTSKVQPTYESLQEAAPHGGLSTKPSTIEQWQRASVPLNDVTSSSADEEIDMSTTDHKLTPMSQQATPSSVGVNQMPKRATPNDHEIGGSEIVSTPDGQIPEAAKTRYDEATLHEDVHGANLPTHDVAKDIFKEAKVADYTPSRSKPIYTQRPTPIPRHREGEDTMDSDKGINGRETVPDRQKMVERRAGGAGEPVSDHLKAIPPSRQAAAEDALGAIGDTIQSPDILDSSKKSRGTYEVAKAPGSTLSKAQSLGAKDVQHTTGESTTPTAGQRKDVSIKPQPDVQDGLKESKLSATNWNGLSSLSSEGKDAIETETNIAGEESFSTDRLRETSKKSEPVIPKEHPADAQGSVKEAKTSSIYQKKPLVARDSHEQAQTISSVGEKADGSTRKHQQASAAPNTFNEELNASEPARAKTNDDFSAEEPYIGDTTDDWKVAPPLLNRELTSEVQPPSEPSHDAALRGELSGKPSTIDQWQRASAPLHGLTTSSGDDEVATSTVDQKPTPMRKKEFGEKRAETSGAERASPSFPGASVDDHATIGHKYAKQFIIDERVGKPIQMQKSSADAHPASEPTKRGTPEGHKIGDLELVSTPDGQISEQTKARDDPDTVHEDDYDVNLSAHDEKKVADLAPSSAKPMYTQQPALTQSSRTQVEEARDKRMQSRETIPEPQKMVERKKGISGEQSLDRQKARYPSVEDAPTGDTIQPPYSPDNSKKSRGTFEEAIGLGSTLPKAQAMDAQDSQLTKGESTIPTADQRKDWKDAKDDGTIMTEEKSFSTERLREMFQESESTTPKTQPTGSQGYSKVDKTSPVYQKGPLAAQESQEEGQIIQAGEKVDSYTPEHQESSGAPYTYNERLSASAPARPDIHDDHSAEEPYEKYTTDDKKVDPYLPSREPASQVQPVLEPLQRADPDGDLPSKSSTIESIDQWRRASAPVHGVSTDSGDAEVDMASNNDQKSIPMSHEATLTSPVPIGAETSDVGRTAPSLPEASRTDNGSIDDKFAKQSDIDERVGAPKQMQEPITAAHPASASTKRTTPDAHEAVDLKLVRTLDGQRLEAAKPTQDAATIHDVHDASLSSHDAAIDEKTATYHANRDKLVTGHVHDRQALAPTSTQAKRTVETPYDSDSSQYVHTGDSGKTELAKPYVTHQEATAPIAGPTSMDPQRAGTLPTEVAHSQQKSSPSGKGSARAAQPLSHVEPIKADSNVSAADYTNAPQMIFRQQARPSVPSTIGIPASDTQAVIGKIQEGIPDNLSADDSGKPSVPSQEQVSSALQAIPDQEEMISPPGATVSPTSDTQLASAEVQEVIPHEQQAVESVTPLLSSGKQGSHVRSDFGPGEVGLAEKKFALPDQELLHSMEKSTSSKPRKEQIVVPTAEQIKEQPTISGQQDAPDTREHLTSEDALDTTPTHAEQIKEQPDIIGQQDTQDTREALTSEDALDTTPTHGDVQPTGSIEPDRRRLSVQGEESTSATQSPPPHVAKDSIDTEDVSTDALGNLQSLKPSTTPDARGIRSGSTPDDVVVAERKSSPSGQDSADSAEPAFSLGPRNKAIRDSTPSALVLSSTDPSKEDAIVARPDEAKDSQTTPSRQDILSTQRPLGKVRENIPGDDLGEDKPLRPSSAVREGKPSKEVPASAPGIQLGSVPNKVALDEQKFALSGQDSAYPAQPPLSAEPRSKSIGDLAHSTQLNSTTGMRNGDDIVAAPDQAKDSQTTPGQQVKLSAPGKAKIPFSGIPDASKETQKSTDDNHIDEKPSGQGRVSSYSHVSEPHKQPTLDAHSDVVDKDTTLGSNQTETLNITPDSTPTGGDALLSNGDVPAASSLPEAQNLQGSAYAQNVPSDFSGKNESPGNLSTGQAMTPRMSPSVPSVAPVGIIPGTNSVHPPPQASIASTLDLGSVPVTQRGIPQGEATPAEQRFTVSDQVPPHTLEPPSSAEPRKEEANAGAGDQPNVPHGQETTVRHQVKAPSPDAREALRKDHEPSHAVLPEQRHDRHTPEVGSTVVDKETTLLSRQAQTSATEPGSTPISGNVPSTSSLQNQDTQPPVTTQAPSTQSLQGSAPTQDDFLRKFESPRQASTDQVISPVTSTAAPSDAPQGQDSAQSIKPPFSTEPREGKTVVTAPEQTKDMDTITHQQATTPAPDTAKTSFPGTDQEEMPSIAGPTSMDPQLASTLPSELARSQQKPAPSEKGSPAAQPLSPVEPIKADNDVSAADYTNASQMIFRQRAMPSVPSTIGIPASDTQAVIGKIQEGNPDNLITDDSGKPSVPSQEQVSPASQAIPDQEEITSPGATVSPTSDTQLASAEVQEVIPHEQQAVESTTLFSSGKQGSHVGSTFGPGEVGPAEKKFAPSDQELPHSAQQSTSSKPRKEQTVPTAEEIKEQPTIIGQQDTPDTREDLTSEDALDTTPTHGDVQPTGSVELDRRPLSVQGEESTSTTQAPPPHVFNDSLDTEDISTDALGNVQSLKPSTTPDARGIPPRSTPDDVAVAEQKSSLSGQDSADPAEQAFSLGPRDKENQDSTPSALVTSSTDPSKGDAIVAGPDEAKDSQTTPSRQDLLSTQHPSGKVRENIPGDDSGKDKPLRAFPTVREGQDSAYPAQHPSSAEPRSKAIGDLAPSTQLNSTTGTRNGDVIFATPDQAKDSQTAPGQQVKLSAPSAYTQHPSGTRQEDEPADYSGEAKSSKPPSVFTPDSQHGAAPDQVAVDEEKFAPSGQGSGRTTSPAPAPGTQYGAELHKADVDGQKFSPSVQDSVHSVQPSFSAEPTKEDTVVAETDQTSPLENIIDQNDMTLAPDNAKAPFMDTPDASRETQKSADDDHINEKPPGQRRVSPYRHVSESSEGPNPEAHSDVVDKETILGSSQALSDQEPAHTSEIPSSAEPNKEEANAARDQPNAPQGPETTVPNQVKSPSPDAREALQKDQQLSHDDDHISNSANPRVVSEEKASHAGRASEGPTSEVSGSVVDKKMTFPSSQAQTSSTGPESTPISGDSRLSSTDVLATSSLQNEEVQTPAATQVPTRAPIDSVSTQNVPAGSLGEITSAAVSDAPQGTEPDEVSTQFSEPPFSAEPSNEASHAGRASESHEGTTRQVHSPVVDAKTTLPSRQVQTANAGPDSTPISGDVPGRSSLQNQEAQASAAIQGPTVQAQVSASTKNEPADSLGDIKSRRQLGTVEVVAPITSFTASSDSSQGTDPGDEKLTTTQGDQAKTLPNGDLPTSQVVGQSVSADSKGMDSQKNFEEALTDENPKMQQQIEPFDTQSSIDNNKVADRTARSNLSTTFEDLQKQPSRPKGSMELSDEPENQQHSLEENGNQAEQSKAHDTVNGEPEDMEASENTNQKNKMSQVETLDHSRKEASAVKQLGENTKDVPNSTEDVPGDVQAISRSKESSRSSEEPIAQLQSEDKTSETRQPRDPREGDLPENSYQNNSEQQ